ncbi:unnamed protein product, partial [Discosporangium mesarthrocarpum]
KAAYALIESGADVNARTDREFTPLLQVAFHGHVHLAKRLLGVGARLDAKNKQGYTAACLASQEGHVDVLRFLLDRQASWPRHPFA